MSNQDKNKSQGQQSKASETAEAAPNPTARAIGLCLAHLERIHGGDVMRLAITMLVKDLMSGVGAGPTPFVALEAMLTELQLHDNLVHLEAARKALGQ